MKGCNTVYISIHFKMFTWLAESFVTFCEQQNIGTRKEAEKVCEH